MPESKREIRIKSALEGLNVRYEVLSHSGFRFLKGTPYGFGKGKDRNMRIFKEVCNDMGIKIIEKGEHAWFSEPLEN